MFWKRLSRLRHTVSFRLTLWYSLCFVLSMLIVFGVAYVRLSLFLQQRDKEELQSKLQEYQAAYNLGGVEGFQKEIQIGKAMGRQEPFFARISGPDNQTVTANIPPDLAQFDWNQLERAPGGNAQDLTTISAGGGKGDVAEIASLRLRDNFVLQVGKSIIDRNEFLDSYLATFALLTLPVLLIGVAGGAFLSLRALRPIRGFLQTLGPMVETGNVSARVPMRGTGDELDELAILFNCSLAKIESLITGLRASLDDVAHDLRTPMTRLRGTAEMALEASPGDNSHREALAVCIEESDQILTLLNTLMDISEAEAGAVKLELQPVNVRQLIAESVELYEFVAEEKGIAVRANVPADLCICADLRGMRRVMANLLDNALKYTPDGGMVAVSARSKNGEVVIAVQDTGIGVPSEEQPKIWNRLYRGDKSRSKRGLGLGLSVVRAVVQAHKGSVSVSSGPGKGSEFTVTLPAGHAVAHLAGPSSNLSQL
jgi:signal transduction histidine kinase